MSSSILHFICLLDLYYLFNNMLYSKIFLILDCKHTNVNFINVLLDVYSTGVCAIQEMSMIIYLLLKHPP